MASIASTLERIKDDPQQFLDTQLVLDACARAGHVWRDRLLDPVTTVRLFMLQVLHGNVACRRLRHLSGMNFSIEAYCKARTRLPIDVFGNLAASLIGMARKAHDKAGDTFRGRGFRGHRVWLIDGSSVSMPDTPALQGAFGQPAGQRAGCGFPVMHVLVLFDAATGLLADLVTSHHRTHDMAVASRVHPSLQAGDVLLGDRGFCSFAHLALLLEQNVHAVFRMHQRQIVSFTPGRKRRPRSHKCRQRGLPTSRWLRRWGVMDQVVEHRKPNECPSWMSADEHAQLPGAIVVRELRYTVARRGYRTREVTLVTTLLDARKYPKAALADLYQQRWQVETNLRALKQTMGMDVLRCKSRDGVLKELWVYVLVYNLVRLRMMRAARRQAVEPNRISFVDALDCLRDRGVYAALAVLVVNPWRPGRHEPRVIKRRKDRYTVMTRPRETLRQELGIGRVRA